MATDSPEASPIITTYLQHLQSRQLSTLEAAEILRMLQHIPPAQQLCEQLRSKLQDQLHPEWIMTAGLAEVFAVIDALHAGDPAIPSGEQLAAVAKRLVSCEAAVGGPYLDEHGQIAFLGNAYIANCLVWMAAPLPNITRYLHDAVSDPAPQYLSSASRLLQLTVLARSQPQQAAQHIEHLTVTATVDDDPRLLALYILHSRGIQAPERRRGTADQPEAYAKAAIRQQAKIPYRHLTEPLHGLAQASLDKVFRADTDNEIVLLAYFFAQALGNADQLLPAHTRNLLGAANVHAWLAYVIYDDFFDDEGQPALLPLANIAMRAMLDCYRQALPDKQSFQEFIHASMVVVDSANSYEMKHLRLAVTERSITIQDIPAVPLQLLADRALLHCFGPLGVMALTVAPGSPQWETALKAFRQYLIARQLADDMHDWLEDLRAGHVSYVVSRLLRDMSLSPGVHNLQALIPVAQQHFWQITLPHICTVTLQHLQSARQAFGHLPLHGTPDNIWYFLDKIEASTQSALAQRAQSQTFLQHLS
jgi:hypothetical protein